MKTAQRLLCTVPVVAAASAALFLTPAIAGAATPAGALDPSFGNAGLAQLGLSSMSLGDVAAYPSGPNRGKVVGVGGSSDGGGPTTGVLIARFNPDGTLDQSFGSGGVVIQSLGTDPYGIQVALDSMGRIVVRTDGAIARFNPDGTLDDGRQAPGAGFGGCGCGFVQPDGRSVTSIAVGPDDVIAYSARSGTYDQSRAFAGELNEDGSVAWEKRLSLSANPAVVDDDLAEHATAVAVGPTGDPVVAGFFGSPMNPQVGAVELRKDGTFVDSFGVNGGQSFDDSQIVSFANTNSLALDSEGRVILGGIQNNSGAECSGWVSRLTISGDLDTSFGGSGTHYFSGDHVYDVAADAQNRILASGRVDCHYEFSVDLGVIRLNIDGSADGTFGSSGRAQVAPTRPALNSGYGMAVTEEGIDVAGSVNGSAVVARFLGAESDDDPPGDDTSPTGGVASELAASPAVDVQRVIAPKKWRKLIRPGVRVLAGCDSDCEVDVTVTVSQKVADAMGIPSTVVARGSGHSAAAANGWVSATAPAKIRDELRNYSGHGRLHVAVTAATPS